MTYVDFLIVCLTNLLSMAIVWHLIRRDSKRLDVDAYHTILTTNRDPNPKDTNYYYGQEWLNSTSNTRWVLERKQVTEDGMEAHWRDITQYVFKGKGGTGSTNIAQAVCNGGSAIASVSSRPKVPFMPYPPKNKAKRSPDLDLDIPSVVSTHLLNPAKHHKKEVKSEKA
jgi:hypothetical protein